ncbi:MAG: DUF3455 domain-containing protein [Isosphaeraceae bacterium]
MCNMARTAPEPLWPTPGVMLVAIAIFFMAVPAGADPGKNPRKPDLSECPALEVPSGNKLAFHTYAEGVQVYRWDGSAWQFVAPEALLFADAGGGGVVGIHFAGPTWESLSGSRVVGSVVARYTADPDSIPWLLLKAVSSEGPGPFHRITAIQRLYTVGGKAPGFPGAYLGDVARVPYTAEYFFYR